ncbi:hypothetical protein [Mesorhizobium sp.]|uniref:hypothetical protein n=1 Tax=Mesorhizobium sp. TaxID=1871066 RepID=UPI000FE4581F|nr:hypothetical protein [Mesorhizobium sp.]RWP57494.1 MAG: hypothetical protein EOR08_30465 [Mesorhizobium sp.]
MTEEYNRAFDRAKRLSDFVGMFTRLAFLVLLTTFVSVQASRASGLTFIGLMCTSLMLGFLLLRLAWFVADAIGKAWTGYLTAKLSDLIGQASTTTVILVYWAGRLGTIIVLMSVIGLSVSLIQYGETLAIKLVEETPAHIE